MNTQLASTRLVAGDQGAPPRRRVRRWPRREIGVFLLSALLVLLVVSGATYWLSERLAYQNALAIAERDGIRLAEQVVAPVLDDALAGVPGRWEELDRDVTNRLSETSATYVAVWAADGSVLYSSDETTRDDDDVPEELPAALAGDTVAHAGHRPESSADRARVQPVLEVFVPLTVHERSVAMQAFFSNEGIDRQAAALRATFLPLAIGALVVLQLVQVPIAMSLARRVRRQETERAELMARMVADSDRERRAIASDVHDGPVQDLAGVSYALSALRSCVPPERQASVDRLVRVLRHAVQSLRRLMVDIYPPDLSGPGLGAAIRDLAEPLGGLGLDVAVETGPLPDTGPDAAAILYRTAKEALLNVARHAQATHVRVTIEEVAHEGAAAVRLEVADDGVGFPPGAADRRRDGHLGLPLLRDRVVDLGGTVTLGSREGGGAVLTAVVPTAGG